MAQITMNPEELFKLCQQSLDLLNATNKSFDKVNDSFEQTINSVKTDGIDSSLVKIYEAIKGMQSNFSQSSRTLNEFLNKQLSDYKSFGETVAEATNQLSNDININ